MISKATIDTVFETVRVEEVISDFVQLKRSGSNYKGLSPFTDERSPSFMVSPVKQIWKDFSSGKGGNAVAFLMEHEHFTYPEAIRYLAKKYNIEIEETEKTDEEKANTDLRESMYLVSEFAQKYFQDVMLNTEEGKAIGYSYFKERGFTGDTIKRFGLGYSPEQWDAFSKEALGKGYQLEFLESTGLTINKEERLIDRFRGRVMFPIHSMSGRILGFGGRILTNDKKAAKYLNSPESDIYHKSKVLYGIFQAKQSIAKNDNCYLVEGYTDVIQFHQAGIENVVASSGTALTPDQIRLVNRLTKNITVLFDGDAAGLRASVRGIDLILEEGMNVKVCTFPDGEDPDSFAKKNSHEQLVSYLGENAKDFIQFKASLLMEEAQNDPIKKADTIRDMVVSISKIKDMIKREVYLKETSRIMDIDEKVLRDTLAQIDRKEISDIGKQLKQEYKEMHSVKNDDPENILQEKVDVFKLLQKEIVKILLLYGHITDEFDDILIKPNDDGEIINYVEKKKYKVSNRIYLNLQEDEVEFADEIFKDLYADLIHNFLEDDAFNSDEYTKNLNPNFVSEVADILMREEEHTLHNWESKQIFVKSKLDTIPQYVSETILSLREYLINKLIADLVAHFTADQDIEQLKLAVQDYTDLKVKLSNEIGRIRSTYI